MSDQNVQRIIEALLAQRQAGQGAMDFAQGMPSDQPLVRMPQWGGMPQGVNPNSMMDVGPEQGLPGGVNPQDMLERLRRGY